MASATNQASEEQAKEPAFTKISLNLPPAELAQLRRDAEELGVTVTLVVRAALAQRHRLLKELENGAKLMILDPGADEPRELLLGKLYL